MLIEIAIENLALIERASLVFGPGLNVITGETGAGKSLLVGALELLLGQRPRGRMVREGAGEARVEGRFELSEKGAAEDLLGWLREHLPDVAAELAELPEDEREILVCRTLSAEGKTRAYVNHRAVTQRALRELAGRLVEVHGQNEHQKLIEPREQARLIDAFGGHERLLATYRKARARWLARLEEVREWEARVAERRDRLDLVRFQLGELDSADPRADEEEELLAERERLRHGAELEGLLAELLDGLEEAEGSALDRVAHAVRRLEAYEEKLPEAAAAVAELRLAVTSIDEAVRHARRLADGLESAPGRLEDVESRLALVEHLKRKHRTDARGLEDLRARLQEELEELEQQAGGRDEGLAELARARDELETLAKKLSTGRRRLRKKLREAILSRLSSLGLEQADVEVRVEPRAAGRGDDGPDRDLAHFAADGADEVELLFAANPGEGVAPLRQVASGGETARVMLALRHALAVKQTIPTLVFDEVDSGVGGHLAPRVGSHLRSLGELHQILCVTHLPAVAASAHRHLRVEKETRSGRTRTAVRELAGDARVEEVADMIAGGSGHETARAEARRLIESAG